VGKGSLAPSGIKKANTGVFISHIGHGGFDGTPLGIILGGLQRMLISELLNEFAGLFNATKQRAF